MKLFLAHFMLQLKMLIREPGYWVPAVIFPSMLFAIFGATRGAATPFAMASFCIYAIAGVAFYQFGVGVAQDRERGFDSWTRTLANSAIPSILARLVSAALFGIIAVSAVLITAYLISNPNLDFFELATLLVACLIAAIPAGLMGITLGYLASARTAVALANLIFLPLAYLGGLWVPPIAMPTLINKISMYTPTRHMGEMAWSAIAGNAFSLNNLISIAMFIAIFAATAFFAYSRDNRKRFG